MAIVIVTVVVGVIVATSTGGISSINYTNMTCEELESELWTVSMILPSTTDEARDQKNEVKMIIDASKAKDCSDRYSPTETETIKPESIDMIFSELRDYMVDSEDIKEYGESNGLPSYKYDNWIVGKIKDVNQNAVGFESGITRKYALGQVLDSEYGYKISIYKFNSGENAQKYFDKKLPSLGSYGMSNRAFSTDHVNPDCDARETVKSGWGIKDHLIEMLCVSDNLIIYADGGFPSTSGTIIDDIVNLILDRI